MAPVGKMRPEAESATKTIRLTRPRQAAILKALADPRRFEILQRIAKAACPLACAEAGVALAISPATLSHHIKELEAAGLVEVRREGKYHYLSLRTEVWSAFLANLAALGQCPRTSA
jgi:ArsR family transcriptional regulator